MTENEKTEETPLTLKMLEEIFSETDAAAHGIRRVAIIETMAALADGIAQWKAIRAATPSTPAPEPAPEAKYKAQDWFVGREETVPQQVVEKRWSEGGARWYYTARYPDGTTNHGWHENAMQAIPPKPANVQQDYKLTGVVEVADGSKPYVVAVGDVVESNGVAANDTICEGRRWMVELDPATCPHCHKELSHD